MQRVYVKPTFEVVELRVDERLADCYWYYSHVKEGCHDRYQHFPSEG